MKPDELNRLLGELVGKQAQKKTISGNTIELWIGCEPKQPNAQMLWIDPPWRIEYEGKIEASSADFPWEKEIEETEEQQRLRFESACDQCNEIEKAKITAISFNPDTADIELLFDNSRVLRSFTTWHTEDSWHYSNYKNNKRYYVKAEKIEVKSIA